MPPLFLPMLVAWCVLWTAAAGIALLRGGDPATERARAGFWGMTALWIAIDLAIVAWALVAPVEDPTEFRRLLLVNGGLDVLYLVTGTILVRRPEPLPKGFGRAILLQGAFLLVLDLAWWLALQPAAATS